MLDQLGSASSSVMPAGTWMRKLAHLVKSMDVAKNVASMNLIKNKPEEDSDFLEAKETSIQCPRRCHRCSDCSDCSVSAQHLTRKEQVELILLEQNMRMDHGLKRMVVKYPIVKKPVSTNNFQQAMKLATAFKNGLKRDGMLDDYNKCVKEFIKDLA